MVEAAACTGPALNKGKRSVASICGRPEGRELVQALATAPGPDAGVLLTNIGTPWLAHEVLAARRADMISCTIQGNGDGSDGGGLHRQLRHRLSPGDWRRLAADPVNHVLPAWDIACAYQAAFAVVAAVDHRQPHRRRRRARSSRLSDVAFTTLSNIGRAGRGRAAAPGPALRRQPPLWRVRPRLRHGRRPPPDGRGDLGRPVEVAGRRHAALRLRLRRWSGARAWIWPTRPSASRRATPSPS